MAEVDRLWQMFKSIFPREQDWLPLLRLKAVRLKQKGKRTSFIAKQLGKSSSTIRKWFNDFEKEGVDKLLPPLSAYDEQTQKRRFQIFSNLLVSRLAEDLFGEMVGYVLKKMGLELKDVRDEYSEADFVALDKFNKMALFVNVKIHSSLFRQSEQFVGLKPEDTFPLAVYKILMGHKYQLDTSTPFVFIVSICWNIVDVVMHHVRPEDREPIVLVFSTRVPGKRKAEDILVDNIVDRLKREGEWVSLKQTVLTQSTHVVISAKKALNLFLEKFNTRCPGLAIKQFASKFGGSRGLPAEINMHLSISTEMIPLEMFLQLLEKDGLANLKKHIEEEKV